MARAYQEAHLLDTLSASVKALQQQGTELTAAKNRQEEKLKNLTLANEALEKRNSALELRVKAKYALLLPSFTFALPSILPAAKITCT